MRVLTRGALATGSLAFLAFFPIMTVYPVVSATPASPAKAVVYLSGDENLEEGRLISEGESLVTTNGVTVELPDGSDVELDAGSQVIFERFGDTRTGRITRIYLKKGAVRSAVPHLSGLRRVKYQVATPVAVAGVRGTDFSVAYDPGSATAINAGDGSADVDVFDGEVEVNVGGKVEDLKAGRGASIERRRVRRREILEKIRSRWQKRREFLIKRFEKRFGKEFDKKKLRNFLKNLDPEKRKRLIERVKEHHRKVWEHLKRAREIRKKKLEAIHEKRKGRREEFRRHFKERRQEHLRERRQERRHERRERRHR